MRLFEKVNKHYSKSFYAREFDQQWKIYRGFPGHDVIDILMIIHDRTLSKLNGKRDIYVHGPDGLTFLVDALDRNRIPVEPKDLMIPAWVHSKFGITPSNKKFESALQSMVDLGEIPETLVEHWRNQ